MRLYIAMRLYKVIGYKPGTKFSKARACQSKTHQYKLVRILRIDAIEVLPKWPVAMEIANF